MRPARTSTLIGAAVLCLAAAGGAYAETAYRVVPDESEVRVLAFRTGALARLGHNHVVTTGELSGDVTLGDAPADSSFELTVSVPGLVVDDPEARAEEGGAFADELSEDDREDTRRNMLGPKLLDANEHPEIRVVSQRIAGAWPDVTITALVTVKGQAHEVELPAHVTLQDDRLTASGAAEITHTALGLEPLSVALGAVRVADAMRFRYRIVATAAE